MTFALKLSKYRFVYICFAVHVGRQFFPLNLNTDDFIEIFLCIFFQDNGTGVKNKIKSNKNIVPKKVRPLKSTQNVTIIYDRSTSPSVLHRPNNKQQHTINNNKQSSLSQSYKPQKILQQQPSNKTQSQQLVCNKVTSIDGQRLEGKKTVVSKSGISITAIKPQSPNNPLVPKSSINSHVTKSPSISLVTKSPYNSSVTKSSNNVIVRSNIGSTTIKPRTETVKTVVTPSPTVHVKPISPGNAAILTKPPKRVTPRKISDTVTMRASSIEKSSDSDMLSRDSLSADGILVNTSNGNSKRTHESDEPSIKRQKMNNSEKKPLHEDYVRLIEACKIADPTKDMDKIVAKLEKYYHRAHTEYINSKSFNKIVKNATDEIKAQPKQVYIKIRGLLDELRTRQSNGERTEQTIENPELKEIDEKKAKKIKKLSDALKILQEKIRKEEESEVDWDDELNSKYLLTERYKKRACEIYDKLCDLTGESRSAERMVKKPIKYNGSQFPEFNRKLEKFINKTNLFPDMFDVLRIIDYCSKEYNYKLDKDYRLTIGKFQKKKRRNKCKLM